MFALLFFALEPDTQSFIPPQVANEGPIISQDWASVKKEIAPEVKKDEFDPSKGLYEQGNMCVVIKGQPLPDCAKLEVSAPLTLNDDIFGINIGEGESTCQTIETIKQDANGNPKRVFSTYCGDEPSRSDFKTRVTPKGSEVAIKPSDRSIGPNQVLSTINE